MFIITTNEEERSLKGFAYWLVRHRTAVIILCLLLLIPSIITGVGYIASAVFLVIALKQLPLGTAYAMWTGMGIVGTTLLGIFLFNEKLSVPQVVCVILIVIGITGLKILGKE